MGPCEDSGKKLSISTSVRDLSSVMIWAPEISSAGLKVTNVTGDAEELEDVRDELVDE
jgi:hypothetical protein